MRSRSTRQASIAIVCACHLIVCIRRRLFCRKLHDLVVDDQAMNLVMNRLPESFTFVQLEHAIEQTHQAEPEMHWLAETTDSMHWLARENYRLRLPRRGGYLRDGGLSAERQREHGNRRSCGWSALSRMMDRPPTTGRIRLTTARTSFPN